MTLAVFAKSYSRYYKKTLPQAAASFPGFTKSNKPKASKPPTRFSRPESLNGMLSLPKHSV